MKTPAASRLIKPLLLLVFAASLASPWQGQAQNPSRNSTLWKPEDFTRHDPTTFRHHAPAKRLIDARNFDIGLLGAAIFYASNEQRRINGQPPFEHSLALRRAAQVHTNDMAFGGYFAHKNPNDPNSKTLSQRINDEGIQGGYRGENIAQITLAGHTYLSAADSIVGMWMKSPGHRRNLLNPRFKYLGCGVQISKGRQLHLLATQNFSSTAHR